MLGARASCPQITCGLEAQCHLASELSDRIDPTILGTYISFANSRYLTTENVFCGARLEMNSKVMTLGEVFIEHGLSWFQEESHKGSLALRNRDTVFNDALTVWLMVAQKGTKDNSLASAVQELKSTSTLEHVSKLVAGSRKFKFDSISDNPGALCLARKRIALSDVEAFSDHMSEKIAAESEDISIIYGYRCFVMDGSTIGLEGDARIVKEFARESNQYGESQPAARVVVAHDVVTGTAYRPEIGSIKISEQALSASLMKHLPRKSLVIADRNFGVFSVAWHSCESSLIPLVRLQEDRVKKLLEKAEITHDCDKSIRWVPSKSDRKTNDFPEDAHLKGRVIAITLSVPNRRDERFYFFTTATDLTPEQLLEIYKYRWLIETDLRSIKTAVHLDRVYAKTPDVAKKEIIQMTRRGRRWRRWSAMHGWAPRACT